MKLTISKLYKYSILCIICFYNGITFSQSVSLNASLDKEEIVIGQTVKLEVSTQKIEIQNVEIQDLRFVDIVKGPEIIIDTTNTSHKKKWIFTLKTLKKGKIKLGRVSAHYKGSKILSPRINFRVLDISHLETDPKEDAKMIAQQKIYLIPYINKKELYVGEPAFVEFRLYYKDVNVTNFDFEAIGNLKGFWIQDVKEEEKYLDKYERRKGKLKGEEYDYVVLSKNLIIPSYAGKLELAPMEMTADVSLSTGNLNYHGEAIKREIEGTFRSKSYQFQIKPLPKGKPNSFKGAVGDFKFSVNASRTDFKTNEATQIKMKISGKGNLGIFPFPEIKFPKGFESFQPEQKKYTTVLNNGIQGSVYSNHAIVSQLSGTHSIAPIAFSYFNPKDQQYHTVQSSAISLKIKQGNGTNVLNDSTPTVIKQYIENTNDHLQYIHLHTSFINKTPKDFFKSPWYYFLLAFPISIPPTIALLWNYRKRILSDTKRINKRNSKRLSKRYLSTAKKEIGNKEHFYEALDKGLHNYLKSKLDINAAELTKENIQQQLLNSKVQPEVVTQLISILTTCENVRYTPSSDEKMQDDFNKAVKTIQKINKKR